MNPRKLDARAHGQSNQTYRVMPGKDGLCIVEYYASIQTKLSLLISFLPNFKA
jgi:hypothetical protein